MDKVKIALTVLSILIIVVPLAIVVYEYRNNVDGLVIPPEIQSLENGGNSNSTGSISAQPQFQPPQLVSQQYNSQTGAFAVSFNFTNPLSNSVSIDSLSAEVVSSDGAALGNISLDQPIQITPGETSNINVSGLLDQNAISQLEAQNPGLSGINISLANLNVNVAGISVHMNQVSDAGQIQLPG